MANPQQLLQQALERHQAGYLDEALSIYNQVIATDPEHFEAHGLLGLALDTLGRHQDAENCYRQALEIRPDVPEMMLALGDILRKQLKLDAAEEYLRRCIERAPKSAEVLCSLGRVLEEKDKIDEAMALYARAVDTNPGFAEAHNCLGCVYYEQGKQDEAIAAFQRAVAADSQLAGAHNNLGNALSKNGRHEEAMACYQTAIDLAPDNPKIYRSLFLGLMRQDDHAGALELCDAVLDVFPGTIDMLAFKCSVLHEMGRNDEARALFDCARFLRPHHLRVPDTYPDLAAFNRALQDHVLNHPTLVTASLVHATQFGAHTGNLLSAPQGPMADFETAITAAIQDYIHDLPDDPSHPFLGNIPARWGLNVWAVVMGEQGHQVPHTHPSAWLSGVYYASTPEDIRTDDPSHAGWLEFGRPDNEIKIAQEPFNERLCPEEGLCVFFPSYFYHNTVPYGGGGTRISIAFDIIAE